MCRQQRRCDHGSKDDQRKSKPTYERDVDSAVGGEREGGGVLREGTGGGTFRG